MWCRQFLKRSISHKIYNIISVPQLVKISTFNGMSIKLSKYKQKNIGVKGLRKHKHFDEEGGSTNNNIFNENSDLNFNDDEYELVVSGAMNLSRNITSHNVLIIQPYIKWGPKRNTAITVNDQLLEAEALVRSLPNWHIVLSIKVPVESLDRKTLFGKGKIVELQNTVQQLCGNNHNQLKVTCIFVNKGLLTFAQKIILKSLFNLPVIDRYSVVIQILRLHAVSSEARLQVAMAEIPYIWNQVGDTNISKSTRLGYFLSDSQKDALKLRERKLKQQLDAVRVQRKLLRRNRKQKNFPIIAVVGYTNAGKTSLIKALTHEENLQPKDQLFATLDVTAHAGLLPCNLKVIYMDTVGFMYDLPTNLIECFISTLEDAMLADLILHVQDVSHTCHMTQKYHVESTLQSLLNNLNTNIDEDPLPIPPILNVATKIDLLPNEHSCDINMIKVSSKNYNGLPKLLLEIEKNILSLTGRQKKTLRIRNGGSELSWLYKNSAVINMYADENNSNFLIVDIVVTDVALQQFKRLFCTCKE